MNAAEQIKQVVSMTDVLKRYGYQANRAGFMPCPFHREKQGSLKIYERSFYCFGCGAGSSVIDFVMRLFGLDFRQAVVRISNDFNLNLTHEKPNPQEMRRRIAAEKRRKYDEMVQEIVYRHNVLRFRRLWRAKLMRAPKDEREEWDEQYCEALRELPALEAWFAEQERR